ncbi:MAG: UDP-N-acetylmuramate dehydrogenase [Ruminococcus sp.]|nr:UDP-N-acetylmuramate dehydrogenase [Ruminococcus sp.]
MLDNKLAEMAQDLGCEVRKNEPLSKHTTFRIGGSCSYMIIPNSISSLSRLVKYANDNNVRTLLLGKGSNMLCADEGFDGVVFLFDDTLGKVELISDDTIRAGSGASLMKVCREALNNSLTGLEFAYGIPGTVGGAVFMNAGAYGGEMKDVLKSVTAMDKGGELHTYPASSLELTYRSSRFVHSGEIILSAELGLSKGDPESIERRMNELMQKRKDKQPLEYPNAGSTFKRPEGQFAGRLIEDSGLCGEQIGGAQVSQKHCGFVINRGNATCEDVKALIEKIQKTVYEKTGFELECEVRIIPYN